MLISENGEVSIYLIHLTVDTMKNQVAPVSDILHYVFKYVLKNIERRHF